MIFKKPYAFLIKYFRVINFILTILTIYIAYRYYNIITFFRDYVNSNYTGSFYFGLANSYISSFMFFVILLIIFGIAGIVLLFIYKKKPNKTYFSSLINYIVLFIFLMIIKNVMFNMETSVISTETARIFRDLSLVFFIPQIIFIILFLIRGLGININKFEFQKDLKELQIQEQDSEEIEITFKGHSEALKRALRRYGREFTYYIKENKFIFIIICLVSAIVIGVVVYKNLPEKVDINYVQGDSFILNNLEYKINDSIITNLKYDGTVLLDDGYYIVVKLNIKNNSENEYEYDYKKFRLELDEEYIYPIQDIAVNFIDYASEYHSKIIRAKTENNISLIYKINSDEIKKNYQIKIDNGSAYKKDIQVGKFIYISISPTIIEDLAVVKEYNLDETINFNASNLGNSELTLSNYSITDKYIYDYDYCIDNNCTTYKGQVNVDYLRNNKTLIILNYNYKLDEEVPFYNYSKTVNKFVDSFMFVKYTKDNQEYVSKVKDITPSNMKNQLALQVDSDIKNADKINLSIIIRNKEYIIKIK